MMAVKTKRSFARRWQRASNALQRAEVELAQATATVERLDGFIRSHVVLDRVRQERAEARTRELQLEAKRNKCLRDLELLQLQLRHDLLP